MRKIIYTVREKEMYPVLTQCFRLVTCKFYIQDAYAQAAQPTIINKFASHKKKNKKEKKSLLYKPLKSVRGNYQKRKRKNPYDLTIKHGDPLNFKM